VYAGIYYPIIGCIIPWQVAAGFLESVETIDDNRKSQD
jgi:hypothetical protein